jgi:TPR repeat protein
MQPAFAYDSAKLAAALESLTPATFANWERRARAGDALAQNVVGMAYKYGEVVPQNHDRSFAWFRKAAEQGDADAQFNMGRIYGKATGPVYGKQRAAPRDDTAAAYWYRKAAEQNYVPAQFNLAQMYAQGGPSFPHDLAQACFWLQKAAAGGDPTASEQLRRLDNELSVTANSSAACQASR